MGLRQPKNPGVRGDIRRRSHERFTPRRALAWKKRDRGGVSPDPALHLGFSGSGLRRWHPGEASLTHHFHHVRAPGPPNLTA